MRDDRNADGDQPTAPPAQQHTDAINNRPRLPDGVRVHDDVDLTADDPTYVPEIVKAGSHRTSHRRCASPPGATETAARDEPRTTACFAPFTQAE